MQSVLSTSTADVREMKSRSDLPEGARWQPTAALPASPVSGSKLAAGQPGGVVGEPRRHICSLQGGAGAGRAARLEQRPKRPGNGAEHGPLIAVPALVGCGAWGQWPVAVASGQWGFSLLASRTSRRCVCVLQATGAAGRV
jgi:hypothetical protein